MNRTALFASLTSLTSIGLLIAHAAGCATGSAPFAPLNDGGPGGKDTGVKTDGSVDSKVPGSDSSSVEDTYLPDVEPTPSSAPTYDPGPKTKPSGAGTSYDDTVGTPCASDTTCDVTGLGTTYCAKGAFTDGALYPTPVCIGASCDAGDGTSIMYCDGINGVCLATSSGGLCLPACDFDGTSGYKPYGCSGKNACNAYGWGNDSTTGKLIGIGYCFGGCWGDSDCSSGEVCQREEGLCVKSRKTYTKPIGAACSKGETDCNCLYATSTSNGYCSLFCKMDEKGWCPGGYTCDAMLPKTDTSGSTLFTKAPATMAGYCLKNCTTDADCSALGGYCEEMAGTGRKTCQVGSR